VCVRVFIGVSAHVYEDLRIYKIYVSTLFLKKMHCNKIVAPLEVLVRSSRLSLSEVLIRIGCVCVCSYE
jgi:hypothetical protein